MNEDEAQPMVEAWGRFFKDRMRGEVSEAVTSSADLVVDFFDVQRSDEILAQHLVEHPYTALSAAQEAIKAFVGADPLGQHRPTTVARVVNLPADVQADVNQLRERTLGRMVSVRGIVQAVGPVGAKLLDALFLCQRCGVTLKVPQTEHGVFEEPNACIEDQGGCGRDSTFKLVVSRERGTVFTDSQVLLLQEPPEVVVGARPPSRIHCFLEGSLCGAVLPSERARVNGVLRAQQRVISGRKTAWFDFYLEVHSIEREARDYDEIVPTPEEVEAFRALAAREDLRERLIGSIAPSIHGRREAKLAILMMLFGGVPKVTPDGQKKRGDIHALFIGDPGTGKSALGRAAAALSPRGHFANALTASVAGMVGGVEKVERSLAGEGWVYQAGVVAMCHRGFLCLDEVDKATDEKLVPALLEPLEQQTASLNKHGARGIMVPCEVSVLSLCNPKGGRFDPSGDDIASQLGLPGPYLDRQDLIFFLEDKPDEEQDARRVDAILRSHRSGNALMRHRRHGTPLSADERELHESLRPVVDVETLRKYIAYAKREVFPELSAQIEARIKAKYTMVRRRRGEKLDLPVGFSTRTIESLVRLTEAAARMRLAQEAGEEDIELALEVYNAGWERLATNSKGQLDSDRFGAAPSYDMRASLKRLKEIIRALTSQRGAGVPGDEIVAEAINAGISRDLAASAVGRWKNDGTLSQRGPGWFLTEHPPAASVESTSEGAERKVKW